MKLTDKVKERLFSHVRAVQVACPLPETATVAVLLGQLFDATPGVSETAIHRLLMLGRVYVELRKPVEALQDLQLDEAAKAYRGELVKTKSTA